MKITDPYGKICIYYGETNVEKQAHGFGVWVWDDGYYVEIG